MAESTGLIRLSDDSPINSKDTAYPSVFRGREGKMNTLIIRFLALNGPSVIYTVAQHLSDLSETKVHYPTVNRRMHELLQRQFLEKVGNRVTKAGIPADLYGLGLRGQFAALAGIPIGSGSYDSELFPSEMRKMISLASTKPGSPFALFEQLIQQGQDGTDLVEKELVPEVVKSIRSGFINIDAPEEQAISSSFASLVARKVIESRDNAGGATKLEWREIIGIVGRALEKVIKTNGTAPNPNNTRTRPEWVDELKALLRLYSVKFG